jgi:hypothetical protein
MRALVFGDEGLQVFDVESGAPLRPLLQIQTEHTPRDRFGRYAPRNIALDSRGQHLVVADGKAVTLFDVSSGVVEAALE